MAAHGGAAGAEAGSDAAAAVRGNVSRSVGRAGDRSPGKAEPAVQRRRFVCDSGRVAASDHEAEPAAKCERRFVRDSGRVAAAALDADQALAPIVPGCAGTTEGLPTAIRARGGIWPRDPDGGSGGHDVIIQAIGATAGKRRISGR